MPIYIYKHPNKEKYIEVAQSMNEDHVYFDENGLEWKREWVNPQLNTTSSIDPWDNASFVNTTSNTKGNMGDLIDRSKETVSYTHLTLPTMRTV